MWWCLRMVLSLILRCDLRHFIGVAYLRYQFEQGDILTTSSKIVIDVHLFYHNMVTHKGQLSLQQPPETFKKKTNRQKI